tara:strand:+ start:391 stop:657 length:267 start_codon:yes stop_codon:yes gene_type:complete
MAYRGGLRKWFSEDWRDIKTGKKCGRSGKEKSKRPYPACRPKKVADKMTKGEKKSAASRKTGPGRVKYAVTASGKRRKKARNGKARKR